MPWHVELFRCDVNGYIPCYVTLKSSAPPQILLSADLQQIQSKVYLFTHGQQAQRLNTLGASCCVSGSAHVVVGYGLLLCCSKAVKQEVYSPSEG